MITIKEIDLNSRKEKKQFIELPFKLYKDNPLWVPPFRSDSKVQLDPAKHPFYEHSEAAFFLAFKDDEVVGRITAIENNPSNEYKHKKQAQFYFFECIEDFEVAEALFSAATEWARARGLNQLVGPKGLSLFDGYGMIVSGYEHRPAMTMMNYNPPYYPEFAERLGFRKEVDFVSRYFKPSKEKLPERVHRIAEHAMKRSNLRVVRFENKKDMIKWAGRLLDVYNGTFVDNWEFYPVTKSEIDFAIIDALGFADPRLIKLIARGDDVVGFLLGFPDVSRAIQRAKGNLNPFTMLDLLIEFKRTKWSVINGMGILPEFQGRGGNAIMYSELEKTLNEIGCEHADLTQVAETAQVMSRDLVGLGGIVYKRHRVFIKDI